MVRHARGSYPVVIEAGLLTRLGDLATGHLGDRQLALITDTTVRRHYESAYRDPSHPWRAETPAGELREPSARMFAVAPGEASKTAESWMRLIDALLEGGFGRDTGIIALGGGMVGDLAGFVAATYLRGIPFLAVPTTLLAMVDASVGGKTGVNTRHGKNLIGAFHPPAAVLADPLTLTTVSDAVLRRGLAEAVKHAVIADASYFSWIDANVSALLARDAEALAFLIQRSVEIKAGIVERDEREEGERALLNAGHTVGHALEHASEYRLDHGEAVALGLVAECALADQRTGADVATPVQQLLERLHLPTTLSAPLDPARFSAAAAVDKKTRKGTLRVPLIAGIGQVEAGPDGWTVATSPKDLLENALPRVTRPTL